MTIFTSKIVVVVSDIVVYRDVLPSFSVLRRYIELQVDLRHCEI